MILFKRKIVGQYFEYTTQPTTQRITQQCIEEARVCPDGNSGLRFIPKFWNRKSKSAARYFAVASIAKASALYLAIHYVRNFRSWAFR